MAAPLEVIVSCDSGSQLWNSTVFDPHSGSSLLSYRGGNSSARTLCVLNGEYMLSAQLGKNFINVWEIQRKDQLQQKIVCPGVVTCLTASPDGLFLAAGVAEAVYLWEVSTGKLLSVLSRHYQDVTCLKFTDDSSHFVSGGKDNLALVWSLCSVIQLDLNHTPEPRHILSRHSLPITDLHCGLMGAQARVATASLDQTVKVMDEVVTELLGGGGDTLMVVMTIRKVRQLWELSSGEMLLSVLFDVEIMSVTFDPCEYFLFCGGSDGNIFQVSLCSQSLSRDKSFQSDNDGNQVFKGHRNLVTCLSVSMDGTLLLSGSHDETVRLWDIQSKQSIRCLSHKGPVTNAVIMAAPANMFLPDSRPAIPLPRFSRHLHASEGDGGESGEVCVRLGLYTQEEEETYLQKADRLNSLMNAVTDKSVFGDGENTKVRVAELEEEVQTLKKVNKDLYDFSSPVTNAVIMAAPANMFLPDSRPAIPLPRFSRHLHASEGDGGESGEVCVRLGLYTQEEEETYLQKADRLNSLMNAVTDKSVFGDGENTKVRVAELEEEVQTLKKVNKDLYDFSSQLLTKPT